MAKLHFDKLLCRHERAHLSKYLMKSEKYSVTKQDYTIIRSLTSAKYISRVKKQVIQC